MPLQILIFSLKKLRKKTNSNKTEVYKFLKRSQEIYKVTSKVFLQRSLHKIKSYLHWDTLKSLGNLGKIDAFRTQFDVNKSIFSDPRVAQLFNRYATYNGSNPFKAPATLNVIPHFEYGFGAFLPKNGMYEIVNALEKLAVEVGVKFNLDSKVEEIVFKGEGRKRRVEGIKCANKFYKADIVVSNLDIYFTYNRLLKRFSSPKKILSQERSSSALIFYWGIQGSFPELHVHNIFFAKDYKEEFDCIWGDKTISADPTVYITLLLKKLKPMRQMIAKIGL